MKRLTTEQALSTVFAYHADPNYGNIPDNEIDQATLFLAKYVKAMFNEIPRVLDKCKFDIVKKQNRNLYDAWTVRVMETVDMRCEDRANEQK